jgi:hypothetical protein
MWGGGGGLLAWPTTAASPQITMEIYISDWTHKFQNKTGLDAKANSGLYKSNQVNSVYVKLFGEIKRGPCFVHLNLQTMRVLTWIALVEYM